MFQLEKVRITIKNINKQKTHDNFVTSYLFSHFIAQSIFWRLFYELAKLNGQEIIPSENKTDRKR